MSGQAGLEPGLCAIQVVLGAACAGDAVTGTLPACDLRSQPQSLLSRQPPGGEGGRWGLICVPAARTRNGNPQGGPGQLPPRGPHAGLECPSGSLSGNLGKGQREHTVPARSQCLHRQINNARVSGVGITCIVLSAFYYKRVTFGIE